MYFGHILMSDALENIRKFARPAVEEEDRGMIQGGVRQRHGQMSSKIDLGHKGLIWNPED